MASQASTGKFFRFQIGCLRLNKSLHEITEADRSVALQRCINLHLREAMQGIDTDDEMVIAAADDEMQKHDYESNSDLSENEIALLYASRLSRVIHREKRLQVLLKNIQQSQAEVTTGFSFVVFPNELFWDAFQNWEFRDVAILCAVWAAIGATDYRRVTFDKITRHSLGYGTEAEFSRLPKKVQPLTRMQVRYTVGKLEQRKLFVRCPVNERHTAYSRKLKLPELVQAIAKRNSKKQQPSQKQLLAEVRRLEAEADSKF